jgi:serine/threonine protein kinase
MTDRDDERNHDIQPNGESADETLSLDHAVPTNDSSDDYVEPHKRTDATSGNRYLIGEVLGEGGMAVVHLATDVQLQRSVAVKRLRSEYSVQANARQRFFAEADILASLDHPGTTSVFEAGQLPDGECFYAMKQVRGRTLGELMVERDAKDLLDRSNRVHFIEIFIRACQTVAAAHNQGVIHRDLKPDNIMVDGLGVVYVMDWGLAKQLIEDDDGSQSDSQRTRLGAVMGTPAYMSPEQASGLAATSDRQTDVFSLGVMLYEILTGLNPFRGETAVESMKGVMYHEPEPPRKLNPRVSRTLSAITMKALDKDPFRRYRSAVELAEDLRRYREYFPVTAIEPTGLEKLANWSRRRPRLATTLATLAVVLVIAALATAFQASVENARVATGYGYIDEVEEQLHNMGREISALTQQRERLEPGPERNAIDSQLAELEAEFEMAEKDRMAIALAITGFTILAPEERAREIVRQSIFDDIEEHIAVGDFYRARAGIRFALRFLEGGNIFSFSEDDRETLKDRLAEVELEIEKLERPVQKTAEPASGERGGPPNGTP